MIGMLSPILLRLGAIAGIAVMVFMAGWHLGSGRVQAKWDAQKQADAQHLVAVSQKQSDATVKVVTQYVNRIVKIKENADAIKKDMPSVMANADCRDSGRIGLFINAAEIGLPVSDAASSANGAGATAADIAKWSVDTIEVCKHNSEQLTALQDWVRQMKGAAE